MSFTKKLENFVCERCGTEVIGNGYTNHCSTCLWSKHVDIDPGDRAAACGGMMEPIAVEGSTGKGYSIQHKCEKCGFTRRNGVDPTDNPDAVMELAERRK